jgi:curli biogenesis system outer membrane secretion channel CsgG
MLDIGTKTSDADFKTQLGEYKGLKHAVGCKDFSNEGGWHSQWDLGNNLSIMLESALFDTGRFVLVEREKLGDVMAEQDLAASGRTAKAGKVAKTGLIRPARYIATGAITVVEENQSGGFGGISLANVNLGGSKGSSQITIIAKLIDTTTGEIVNKKTITGKAGRVGFGVGIAGSVGGHGFGTDLGGFAKTPLAEAAQDCINQAALFFAKEIEKMPFDAAVVKASSGKVYINRGSKHGIEVGKAFVMREEGEMLTDPDTGAIIGTEQGKEIGKLKVVSVMDEAAVCEVTDGENNPKVGTRVVEQ